MYCIITIICIIILAMLIIDVSLCIVTGYSETTQSVLLLK